MTGRASYETLKAVKMVMAGKPVSYVARKTGVSRSTIHRHLLAKKLTAPVQGKSGRPPKRKKY